MLDIRRTENNRIFLVGRFDASQVPGAHKALDPIAGSFVLDLSELEYISSAGIGFIIATYKRVSDAGHSMSLANPNPRILNVFRLSGLDRVLTIESA